MRAPVLKPVVVSVFCLLVLSLWVGQGAPCYAQAQAQPDAPPKVAALHDPLPTETNTNSTAPAAAKPTAKPDPDISLDIAKELAVMKARIEQLEADLKSRAAPDPAPPPAAAPPSPAPVATATATEAAPSPAPVAPPTQEARASLPAKPAPTEPFAYADWTWLNGTARNKDAVWDSKFFTPEIRLDTDFVSSFNHPKDDTIGGSTEIFRSNEVQLDQISFGGAVHWQDVRARILTMGGMFAVTTPRNDGSFGRGQWDLRGAYKYFSEAYGGYHFNVNHGLNVDAGIFVSYIGLFSYYNFDNWAYQPSYVSSNTPWFFNGLRIQWFPTNKLKIEPWIINGWQSYGRLGSRPGLGGQILWRPKPWVSMVFNNYGMGEDNLGLPKTQPIHTDDSVDVRYYNKPENLGLSKMAFSLTGDAGCQYGGGLCGTCAPSQGKESFVGWMAYDRYWFHKD